MRDYKRIITCNCEYCCSCRYPYALRNNNTRRNIRLLMDQLSDSKEKFVVRMLQYKEMHHLNKDREIERVNNKWVYRLSVPTPSYESKE